MVTLMGEKREDYLAYLLRIWRIPDREEGGWLASLENVNTRRRLGFVSLDALFAFLRKQCETRVGGDREENTIEDQF